MLAFMGAMAIANYLPIFNLLEDPKPIKNQEKCLKIWKDDDLDEQYDNVLDQLLFAMAAHIAYQHLRFD